MKKISLDKKYSRSSLEDFLRYLDGNLSDRERNRIERNLMKDPFKEEAMEGFSRKSIHEIREDIEIIDQQISKRVSGKRSFTWYRVAAVAAVLLAISITFITVFDDRIGQLSRKVADTERKSEEPVEQSGPNVAMEERQEQTTGTAGIIADETAESLVGETSEEFALETESREDILTLENREAALMGEAVTDEAVTDEAVTDEAVTDEAVKDEAVTDEAVTDEAVMEEAVMEEAIMEEAPAGIAAQPLAASKARMMDLTAEEYTAGAGQRTIRGTIVSAENDLPLRGASIMVKGTETGVLSDMSGNFSIPVNEGSYNTLVADYIGMEPKEVAIGDQSEMEIILQPDQSSLDELVLVGSGEGETIQPAGFEDYIERNIRFPEGSELTRAVVVLNFAIAPDGRPDDIAVLSSPDESFSNEAIRLLNEGPDWNTTVRDAVPAPNPALLRILFIKDRP